MSTEKTADSSKNFEKVERSLLELGTELYRLKIDFNKLKKELHSQSLMIKSLCKIIDDLNISTDEDIELLSESFEDHLNNQTKSFDVSDYSTVVDRIKKNLN